MSLRKDWVGKRGSLSLKLQGLYIEVEASLVLWKRPVALPVSTFNSGVEEGEEVFTVGQLGLLLTVN